MRLTILLNPACLFVLAATTEAASNSTSKGKPILIDTDLYSDVDDVGALTVANVLHNCGLADLRGVLINTQSRYGALCASAINTYFGNGDVPIAAIRPLTNASFFDAYDHLRGEYAARVAYNWPRTVEDTAQTATPVQLYRSLLASAENNSLTFISIGFLTNIADVLRSPGDFVSAMTGSELIASKVAELVVMGGEYPSGWEYNFGGSDPQSTAYVLRHWPRNVPMTFSGGELGGGIYSGQHLREHAPPDSPVFAAYEWYVGRCSTIRESWDPITTLYGILGLDGFDHLGLNPPFAYANEDGYNSVTAANGSNAWVNDTGVTNQHWLKLADGVSNSSVAWMLDQLFAHDPLDRSCFGFLKPLQMQQVDR